MQKKYSPFYIALLLNLVANATIQTDSQTISFGEIGHELLHARGFVEKKSDSETDSNNKKVAFDINQLDELEQLNIVCSLFHRTAEPQSISGTHTIKTVVSDLELFSPAFFDTINRTITPFGVATLARTLTEPTCDVQKIKNRQALIQLLASDDDVRDELTEHLTEIRKATSGLFSFWAPKNYAAQEVIKKQFLNSSSFDANPVSMECYTRLGNLGTAYITVGVPILVWCLLYYCANQLPEIPQEEKTVFGCLNLLAKGYTEIKNKFINSDGGLSTEGKIIAAYYVFLAALYGYGIKQTLDLAIMNKNAINHLQTRLIDVATCVNATRSMLEIADDYPELYRCCPHLASLKDGNFSSELTALLNLLDSNTFKGQASFFSLSGKVLAAYTLMEKVKDELHVFMKAIGEVDLYVSLANLHNEFSNERVQYSFVEFIEDASAPSIVLEEAWFPVVDPKVVVTNSIGLGQKAIRNMIITGSNTGGKSTFLKSTLFAVLGAHTIGMVPCKYMKLTPFAGIGSYLHILDNTAQGYSLFMVEVIRVQSLVDMITKLAPNEFYFVVIDELFTGTSAEKGEGAAYDFIRELDRECPNTIFMLATHFARLTVLPEEQNSNCSNYKMEAFLNEQGNIVRPFKLEPGISMNNIAETIIEQQLGQK